MQQLKKEERKTHSDRYLDFDSHHPLAHKVAVARTLLTRADRICASAPDRDVEKRWVTVALSSNGYPTALVKKNWHPTPHSTPPPELDTPKAVVVIPYVKHLSEFIRRILSPLIISEISLSEIDNAIQKLKCGKSASIDKVTIFFFSRHCPPPG